MRNEKYHLSKAKEQNLDCVIFTCNLIFWRIYKVIVKHCICCLDCSTSDMQIIIKDQPKAGRFGYSRNASLHLS